MKALAGLAAGLGLVLCLALTAGAAEEPAAKAERDFQRVAGEVAAELVRAREQARQTRQALARRRRELTDKLAALKSRLESRRRELEQTRQELERASRLRQELSRELADKSGDLKELAGIVRGAARGLLSLARRSAVTGEYPTRLQALEEFLPKGRFPGLADIKRLVDLYFQEMEASGRIGDRRGAMVDRRGKEVTGRIVRLGALCTIYQRGGELGYLLPGPGSGRLLATGAEPPWWVTRNLARYLAGQADSVYLDISGGAALWLLSHRESFKERLLSGGPLVWPILLVGLVGLVLILERLVFLRRVGLNTDELMERVNQLVAGGRFEQARAEAERWSGRPTSNVIKAGLELRGQPPEVIDNGLSEAMLRELPRLERSLTTLKVLAAVAPLLGLLGTVTGMINTFQVITAQGAGDPRLMAGGISEALVTTQFGLAVAIPLFVAASLMARRAQRLAADMEEKALALSAALIRDKEGA